jgi:hypothetical protein
MNSLFSKIYKYRESSSRNQKENFVIEILSYALKNDSIFSKEFLKYIELPNLKISNCDTQISDSEQGRPDISIELNDGTLVLIECKIDSLQGYNQINRYINLIQQNKNKKSKLIYLTKYQELIDIDSKANFQQIKWQNIHDLLEKSTNTISIEFRNFLIENKMSTDYKFEKHEASAIKSINDTILKLNDLISRIKAIAISQKYTNIKNHNVLRKKCFGISFDLNTTINFWIGFYQFENHNEMQFGSEITLNNNRNKDKYINSLSKNKYKVFENGSSYLKIETISYFYKEEELDIQKLLKYAEDLIVELKEIGR